MVTLVQDVKTGDESGFYSLISEVY